MSTVLVTGGSGFVGSYAVAELLKHGHTVRTTVRNPKRKEDVLAMMQAAGVFNPERLTFFTADLECDEGWAKAAEGCDYVLHVASPFPGKEPEDENELIRPAKEGTLRVLRFALNAHVRRVVMTSSFAAIGYGHPPTKTPFTEKDWTNLDVPLPAYIKSKAIAERAAWDFVKSEGRELELSVINPTGIFGPVLGKDYSASVSMIKQMLDGKMPGCPRIYFGIVDVRDVVDLHLRAMTSPAAAGERFIAVAGQPLSLSQVAAAIRQRLGADAARVPAKQLPDFIVRAMAIFNPNAKRLVSELGKIRGASNEKARRVLGWSPRSSEDAVVASAKSLLALPH
jgi:nucleoside-diphosphate-sugar epimerase